VTGAALGAMRVLVTGGTGYLGSAIVAALRKAGHRPVVFARRATTAFVSAGGAVEAVDGDVRDAVALAHAARGCDGLVHAAALVSIWQRDRTAFHAVNVGGLSNAVSAVREHGIRRVVYTSSFLALPPPGATAMFQIAASSAVSGPTVPVARSTCTIRALPGASRAPISVAPFAETSNLMSGSVRRQVSTPSRVVRISSVPFQ